jgi:sugar phosphate isomerase/epimerase
MPYRLSAFADVISTDIQVQMDHLLENGIRFCAMRGANNRSVLELEDFQVQLTKTQFFNRGVRFSCIATPVGRALATAAFDPETEGLKKSIKLAKVFETKVIRIFSPTLPAGADPAAHQTEIHRRMKILADLAKAEGANLLLENEQGTYADTPERLLELLDRIGSSHVRAAFDVATFVKCGIDPLDAWGKVKKQAVDIHINDAKAADGRECLVGSGDGKLREVLADAFGSNWAGYLTLEPRIVESGEYKGITGSKLFKASAEALAKMLGALGVKQP